MISSAASAGLLWVYIAVLALLPYATVSLPTHVGLYVQAALVAIWTGFGLVVGVIRRRRGSAESPRVALLVRGVVLYGAVSLIGAAVGLLRGNEPVLLVGQLVSMALLPMGFATVVLLAEWDPRRHLAVGLTVAGLLAALVHISYWLYRLSTHDPAMRLYLPNGVSFGGLALLALLMAIVVRGHLSEFPAIVATVSIASLTTYVLGTQTRSLLITSAFSIVIFITYRHSWKTWFRPRLFLPVTAAIVALASVSGAAGLWWNAPRPDILPNSNFESPFWRELPGVSYTQHAESAKDDRSLRWSCSDERQFYQVTEPFGITGATSYRLSSESRSEEVGAAWLFVVFQSTTGDALSTIPLELHASEEWLGASRTIRSPSTATTARLTLGCVSSSRGDWWLRNLKVENLGHGLMPVLGHQIVFATQRMLHLPRVVTQGEPNADPSLSYRLMESRAVRDALRDADLITVLFGKGLGARLDFETLGYDIHGQLVKVENPNYLHNFYAFLAYKTGFVGLLTVLASFVMWAWGLHRCARHSEDPFDVAFHGAASAAFLGYALWSLVAPEILDFRNAPIWGAVLGAAAVSRYQASAVG
jgi:hypothetical protein